jgi:hypothetical protein
MQSSRTSSGTSVGDFTLTEITFFSATRRSIDRLVGLRDRAFEPADSVTDDAGQSTSSLSVSSLSSGVLGVNVGIFVLSRTGIGGAEAGLCLARTSRGVASGSMTSSTCTLFLMSLAFLAAILLDVFDGDGGACDIMGVGAFSTRRRLHRRGSFGWSISASAVRLRLGLEKDAGKEGRS